MTGKSHHTHHLSRNVELWKMLHKIEPVIVNSTVEPKINISRNIQRNSMRLSTEFTRHEGRNIHLRIDSPNA